MAARRSLPKSLARLPRALFFAGLIFAILATLVDLVKGPGSLAEVRRLHRDVEHMRAANTALEHQNAVLTAEIRQLRSGTDAIEEQAREQLGMIKKGETFYLMEPPGDCGVPAPRRTDAASRGSCGQDLPTGSGSTGARGSNDE